MTGAIPVDILKRLPEWCVYIETPGYNAGDRPLHGFFACTTRFKGELVLHIVNDFMDIDRDHILPYVPIPLTHGTIEEAIANNARRSIAQLNKMANAGAPMPSGIQAAMADAATNQSRVDGMVREVINEVGPLLSLLLYLCAEDPDLDAEPIAVTPLKTKRGERYFAALKPNLIGVGLRLGARLRDARQRYDNESTGARGGMTAHLRKAHWHSFWAGPLSGVRERRIHWLHPILVNDRLPSDAPAVLHPVEQS